MKNIETILRSLRVDTITLKQIEEGASEVFTEREGEAPGSHSHGLTRSFSKRKFKTQICYLVGFNPVFIIPVILVTRIKPSSKLSSLHSGLRIFTYRIKKIREGKSRIFTERKTVKSPGSAIQAFAQRTQLKIKTRKCLLLIPKSLETLSVVIVTKLKK